MPFYDDRSFQPVDIGEHVRDGENVIVLSRQYEAPSQPKFSLGSSIRLGRMGFTANYNVDLMGGFNPLDMFSVEATLELGDVEERQDNTGEGAVEK